MIDKFEARQHEIKKPFEVRSRIQELLALENKVEMHDGVKKAVIHSLLGKSIREALGFRNLGTGKYDYSKSATEKTNRVRRLVLGWLLLPDDCFLKPISSSDSEIVTPLAVNAISRWISYNDCGDFVRRPTFGDELLQVIYCAQFDYELCIKSDVSFSMAELMANWKKKDSENGSGTVSQHFEIDDFRRNFVSVRGPEMLHNAMLNLKQEITDGASVKDPLWNPSRDSSVGLPDGAVWCEWCGNVIASPGTPCKQCSELGAIPVLELSNDSPEIVEKPADDLSDLDELFW